MPRLHVSCNKFACRVVVDEATQTITDAEPAMRRFVGQPIRNLYAWFAKFGNLRIVDLDEYSL